MDVHVASPRAPHVWEQLKMYQGTNTKKNAASQIKNPTPSPPPHRPPPTPQTSNLIS